MNLKQKYGGAALIAGASEGLGAAYANALAAQGFDVILVARRKELLEQQAQEIELKYKVKATPLPCDLAHENATSEILSAIGNTPVGMLVYNAALPHIGPYHAIPAEQHAQMATVNMVTPLRMIHALAQPMLQRGKGGIVLMSSLAGFQGSGFLSTYAATKAFNRILAEGLWYEWKDRGVDVIGCCAGATSTPGFIKSNPGKAGLIEPPVQTAEAVVKECFEKIGKQPSFISGTGNKLAAFFMNHLLTVKTAVTIMGDTTRKMYRL